MPAALQHEVRFSCFFAARTRRARSLRENLNARIVDRHGMISRGQDPMQ